MRALTKPWRSLAYLYSAFSERSPCARATAISLGKSTFNSCASWSISSSNFCFILASGSCMFLSATYSLQRLKKDGGVRKCRTPLQMIIDGVELRPQGAPARKPQGQTLLLYGPTIRLLNLDIQCL